MILSLTRSDLKQLSNGQFDCWAIEYNQDSKSFQAGPTEIDKQDSIINSPNVNGYSFENTYYVDGLRIFEHESSYELVLFKDQQSFLTGLSTIAQLVNHSLFGSQSEEAAKNQLLASLESGLTALGTIVQPVMDELMDEQVTSLSEQLTLNQGQVESLTEPSSKWIIELEEEPFGVKYAGEASIKYKDGALYSYVTDTSYAQPGQFTESFTIWKGNLIRACAFQNQTDFAKGLKFWASMFDLLPGYYPEGFQDLLDQYSANN